MDFIRRICLIYIIITFLSFVNSRFLKAVYSGIQREGAVPRPPFEGGMLQTMQVIPVAGGWHCGPWAN